MGNRKVDMIWVDVETTGLSPAVDRILEIAVVLTDRFGGWIAGDSWIMGDSSYRGAIDLVRSDPEDVVGPMHEASGLWEDWNNETRDKGRHCYPGVIQDYILDEFLGRHGVAPNQHPMCGASVHFDRAMLKVQLPKLESFFHYRNFDISTMRQAAEWLNPSVAGMKQDPELRPHRAFDDCVYEIQLYKHYVDNFLFVTEEE
jgi:oligoribonuclease